MKRKHLLRLQIELRQMRKSPSGRKASDFISIANQLGMKRDKRGKEPNYVRTDSPKLSPPLSIPGHPGDLKPGTARSIIDALISHVDDWLIYLDEVEDINE